MQTHKCQIHIHIPIYIYIHLCLHIKVSRRVGGKFCKMLCECHAWLSRSAGRACPSRCLLKLLVQCTCTCISPSPFPPLSFLSPSPSSSPHTSPPQPSSPPPSPPPFLLLPSLCQVDSSLSFMDDFVTQSLAQGASRYKPPHLRPSPQTKPISNIHICSKCLPLPHLKILDYVHALTELLGHRNSNSV